VLSEIQRICLYVVGFLRRQNYTSWVVKAHFLHLRISRVTKLQQLCFGAKRRCGWLKPYASTFLYLDDNYAVQLVNWVGHSDDFAAVFTAGCWFYSLRNVAVQANKKEDDSWKKKKKT